MYYYFVHIMEMDVLNTFSLSSVHPIWGNLNDKEIISTVGGEIAFIAAYQEFQDNNSDPCGNDTYKHGRPQRKNIVDQFFAIGDKSLIICKQRTPFFRLFAP